MKVIVVGAGLFGSIAAALARKAGHQVTVIDSNDPWAASKCSGNLTKPSWLESLGKEKAQQAYEVLRELYQVQKIDCVLQPLLNKHVALDWVNPKEVLLPPDVRQQVTEVGEGYVRLGSGQQLRGAVLIAAGVGCSNLIEMPPIKSLVGSSLRIKGQIAQPAIYLYAPYKHAVAFNLSKKEIWCGDGAAIIDKNWSEAERVGKLLERAQKFFKLDASRAEVRIGARPYVIGYKGGFFAQVAPKVWVSTGGAKNGLVLAAYQAKLFVEAIG